MTRPRPGWPNCQGWSLNSKSIVQDCTLLPWRGLFCPCGWCRPGGKGQSSCRLANFTAFGLCIPLSLSSWGRTRWPSARWWVESSCWTPRFGWAASFVNIGHTWWRMFWNWSVPYLFGCCPAWSYHCCRFSNLAGFCCNRRPCGCWANVFV